MDDDMEEIEWPVIAPKNIDSSVRIRRKMAYIQSLLIKDKRYTMLKMREHGADAIGLFFPYLGIDAASIAISQIIFSK